MQARTEEGARPTQRRFSVVAPEFVCFCISVTMLVVSSVHLAEQRAEINAGRQPGMFCEVVAVEGSLFSHKFVVTYTADNSRVGRQRINWNFTWSPYDFIPGTTVDCYGDATSAFCCMAKDVGRD